jgi:Predicted permeases
MIEVIRREALYLWYYFSLQAWQILPYWFVGILLGSCVSVFAKARIHGLFSRLEGRRLGLLGLVPASVLGIASPLCMYGTIPLAASFREKGMREDWLAAFMMSSMLLNPQLIIYSTYLGPNALVARLVSSFLCGIVAGLLIFIFYRGKSFFDFSGFHESASRDTDPNMLLRLLKNMWRNVKATGPAFLLGIGITALYQRYVPTNFVAGLFGSHRGFGVLMAAALGVPVYVCGGGTIPLILEWLDGGMSLGAAAAFMITGPATKITNLSAVKTVLGARRFAAYIIFAIAFACATGLAIDALGIAP